MSLRLARLPLRSCSRRLFSQQTQTTSIVLQKAAASYAEFRQRHPVFAPIQVRVSRSSASEGQGPKQGVHMRFT